MAKKKKNLDTGGPDQGWIVTFSDCMTLLLCFFVLLLTFSSFDENEFDQLAGAFQAMSYDWLEKNPARQRDSFIDPVEMSDGIEKGSMKPTDKPDTREPNRPSLEMLDADQHKDRTSFYLPSSGMFWGKGVSITSAGRRYLQALAKYLKIEPCRIIVGESSGSANRDLGYRRAWQVMNFLVNSLNLAPNRFNLDADCVVDAARFGNQPVVKITLMRIDIEK